LVVFGFLLEEWRRCLMVCWSRASQQPKIRRVRVWAASDVYKRQILGVVIMPGIIWFMVTQLLGRGLP